MGKIIRWVGLSVWGWAAWTSWAFAQPRFQTGEWMRFQAKAGGIEGGDLVVTLKQARQTWRSQRLQVHLQARTNNFFDKVYRINNTFESDFVLGATGAFRAKVHIDQATWQQKQDVLFSARTHGTREALLHRQRIHAGRLNGRMVFVQVPPRSLGAELVFTRTNWHTQKSQWLAPYEHLHYVPLDTHDLGGLLYYTRTLPMKRGRTFQTHLFSVGYVWKVQGVVVGRTKMASIFGIRGAYQLQARACHLNNLQYCQSITVWLSDDPLRIPLKIESQVRFLGAVTAELVGYRRSYRSPQQLLAPQRRFPLLFGRSF